MTPPPSDKRCAADGHWTSDPLLSRILGQGPLLRVWARREVRIRYQHSVLGLGWAIVQPLAMLVGYGLVLSGLLGVTAPDGLPYASFAFAGIVPWTFFASTISTGVHSLVNSGSLISKVYFPREVVPLSVAVACSVDLAIATVMLLGLAAVQGFPPRLAVLALVPIDLSLVVWVAGLSTVVASMSVFVRDLRHAVPLVLQLLFFASPIMYPATLLPQGWRWIESASPLAFTAKATRDAVLRGEWPSGILLAAHLAAGTGVLLLAIAYTRSVEPRMVDVA